MREQHDPEVVIEKEVSLRAKKGQDMSSFLDKGSRTYQEALFTEEKKYMFLVKAALCTEEICSFTLPHSPNTINELREMLKSYDESRKRFRYGEDSTRSAMVQNVRIGDDRVLRDEVGSIKRIYVEVKVDALSAHSAELPLIIQKKDRPDPLIVFLPTNGTPHPDTGSLWGCCANTVRMEATWEMTVERSKEIANSVDSVVREVMRTVTVGRSSMRSKTCR